MSAPASDSPAINAFFAQSDGDRAIKFSVFESAGDSIGKRYSLDGEGNLSKVNGGYLISGTVETKRFETIFEVANFANIAPPETALGFGVCGHAKARLVTAAARRELAASNEAVVSRTKDCFAFAAAPGVLHLDYDPRPGEDPMTADEFVEALRSAVPDLQSTALAVKSSSSAHVSHPNGVVLKGAGGLHIFIPVEDATSIRALGHLISKRLWLAGHGWIKITGNGTTLPATCIDLSVLSPERLCFCSAHCEDGITQALPDVKYYPGEADDLIGCEGRLSELPNLSGADEVRLADLQREAFTAAASEADVIRRAWAEARADDASTYAKSHGRTADRDALVRGFAGDFGQALPPDLILHLHDGSTISVDDVRQSFSFNGVQMADPIEPTYGGDSRIAMAVLDAAEPYIFSHAHGGQCYYLQTDEERLNEIAAGFDDLGEWPRDRRRFEAIPASDFAAGAPTEWFVKGILPVAALGVLFGASGSGKSFLIFDMVANVALGKTWRSLDVRQADVIYVCAEGAAGFRKRIRAYEMQRNCSLGSALRVIGEQPNLLAGGDLNPLIVEIACVRPRLVVIDTLAQIMPGGDENNSVDIGKVLLACRRIYDATGAMVLLVHHSGKDAARGARGWSGLRAAVDVELEVSKDGPAHTLRVTKMKDGEADISLPFRLLPIDVDVGPDDETITSCVIEHVDGAPHHTSRSFKLGATETAVLDAFGSFLFDVGSGIPIADLIGVAASRLAYDRGAGATPKRDQRRETCMRALASLARKSLVKITGDQVALVECAVR